MKPVFLWIPATGGTSVWAQFMLGTRRQWAVTGESLDNETAVTTFQHATGKHVLEHLGEARDAHFIFSFTRHPLDRLVSIYHKCKGNSDAEYRSVVAVGDRSFAAFARHVFSGGCPPQGEFHSTRGSSFARPQTEWLYDDDRLIPVFVGRTETMQKDWERLHAILGLACKPIPHVNKTEHREHMAYYDADLLALATDYYREDYERLGYA
jgi:hypothetical protein